MVAGARLLGVAAAVVLVFFWGVYTLHTFVTHVDETDRLRLEHVRDDTASAQHRQELDQKLAGITEQLRTANRQLADLRRLGLARESDKAHKASAGGASAGADEADEPAEPAADLAEAALQVLPRLHRIHRAIRQHQYSSDWAHRKVADAVQALLTASTEAGNGNVVQKAQAVASLVNDIVDNNFDDLLADQLDLVFQSTLYGIEISRRAAWLRDLLREDIFYLQFPSLRRRFDYERRGLAAAREAAAALDLVTPDEITRETCATRRMLVCDLSKACGFGCQMHHVAYCLMTAYGSNRTLVIDSAGWVYASGGGWTSVFEPFGECGITSAPGRSPFLTNSQERVTYLNIIDGGASVYAPSAMPRHYHDILATFHSNPPVWWVGQFVSYLLRPNAEMQQFMTERRARIGWAMPGVGMQIRRTDKIGTEAAFHDLAEYMGPAEYYFETHLKDAGRRLIFLATDDPGVVSEARTKHPTYSFANDADASESASVRSRYSVRSLRGVVADVLFLSEADYIVCTFSSQICRLAFEAMQGRHVDASWRYTSLDDPWYFGGGQREHLRIWATPPATSGRSARPTNAYIEIALGDVIENHARYEGFYWKGLNTRTRQTALYPALLAEPEPRTVEFPDYPGLRGG